MFKTVFLFGTIVMAGLTSFGVGSSLRCAISKALALLQAGRLAFNFDVAWTLRRTLRWRIKSAMTGLLSSILLLSFFSCNEDFDSYSSNPNDVLTFSTDTLAFDTIISAVRTPYQAFMIRNPNKKALLISSVSLENGANSDFQLNVDGRAGQSFGNIEIRPNDSLYVLVDAIPKFTQSDEPQTLFDKVIFVTNNVQQSVVLQVTVQDCEMWKGKHIASDTTLAGKKPFVIYDSLVVDEGVKLEIAEGVKFYMHSNAEIIVHGTLQAHGTQENPVIIRGDRFDYWIGIPYDRVPGQWGGIRFSENSFNNELENMRIRNGKTGLNFEKSTPEQLKIKIKNAVLTNFKGVLLSAENCRIEVENSELSNAKDGLVNLDGGNYTFIHCTLANYYSSNTESGWGNSNQETVQLSGNFPLQANFYNTIISGNGQSDIRFHQLPETEFHTFFKNCLIPNKDATNDEPDDPNAQLIDCIIHEEPLFLKDEWKDFHYNFRLQPTSPAVGAADKTYSLLVPYDLDGTDRLKDERPDIGAFEMIVIEPLKPF